MRFTHSLLCRFFGDTDDDWTEESVYDSDLDTSNPEWISTACEVAAESFVQRMYNEGDVWREENQHRVEVKPLDSDDIRHFLVYVDYDPTFTAYPIIGESHAPVPTVE